MYAHKNDVCTSYCTHTRTHIHTPNTDLQERRKQLLNHRGCGGKPKFYIVLKYLNAQFFS